MSVTRRDVLRTAAATSVAVFTSKCTRSESGNSSTKRGSVLNWSARQMARAIRDKEISSEELMRSVLAKIEEVNPRLNAVVQLRADAALAEARKADAALRDGNESGPLHGVPMTIKDSFDTAGVISTAGTQGRANFVPKEDASIVARLKKAGAILVGKTNTPEFTLLGETDNLVYGRTNNPYDPTRTPGASSGGAAAIVAASGSPFDIGSDTGGSIRMPADYCGVAGLKPTSGRVPRTGHIISFGGALDSFTHVGPIARHVEDLELLVSIITGSDWRDPSIVDMPLLRSEAVDLRELRIAYFTDLVDVRPTSATSESVRTAARILADAGAKVEEQRPPRVDSMQPLFDVGFADGGDWIRRLVVRAGTRKSMPGIEGMTTLKPVPAAQLMLALEELDLYRSDVLSFMQRFDAIICPAGPGPAFRHGEMPESALRYLVPFNLTGQPAAVVRAGTSPEGLPIGVQIVTRKWREDVAIALARRIEMVTGGWSAPQMPARTT